MVFCPKCGSKLPEGSYYCMSCGAQIPTSPGQSTYQNIYPYELPAPVEKSEWGKSGSLVIDVILIVVGVSIIFIALLTGTRATDSGETQDTIWFIILGLGLLIFGVFLLIMDLIVGWERLKSKEEQEGRLGAKSNPTKNTNVSPLPISSTSSSTDNGQSPGKKPEKKSEFDYYYEKV